MYFTSLVHCLSTACIDLPTQHHYLWFLPEPLPPPLLFPGPPDLQGFVFRPSLLPPDLPVPLPDPSLGLVCPLGLVLAISVFLSVLSFFMVLTVHPPP